MPLSNRAPIDASGKLMVTTTVPTPAWPSLGGMTYKPDTGELAVIDAVPPATEPWVGGIRFTNLGSMYVWSAALPAGVEYIGGIPVTDDGRVVVDGSGAASGIVVGGWPIGAGGGVPVVGLSAQPIFWAPLTNSLIPVVAGNPTFTFARATLAYAMDQDGILRQAQLNEARFQGARRVRNAMVASGDNTAGIDIQSNVTLTPTTVDFTAASAYLYRTTTPSVYPADQPQLGARFVLSVTLSSATKPAIGLRITAGTMNTVFVCPLTATPTRFTVSGLYPTGTTVMVQVGLDNRVGIGGDGSLGLVTAVNWQLERVEGQSNQAPGEYVSVGVLAAPYHGNWIDGVKYFATTNGNSVAGNVVTEATGALIPAASLLGYVAENQATNMQPQSQDFDVAATWTVDNGLITPNAIAAPDGTMTADMYTDNATSGFHRVFASNLSPSGVPCTWSVYLKRGTLTWAHLLFGDGSPWANFNLATGTVGFSANATAAITALPNGWYRCSVTATIPLTSSPQIWAIPSDVNGNLPTYVGTGQTMYLWGAQHELASDPSSYIPTTTGAVIRNGDALNYHTAGNTNLVSGTSYMEVYPLNAKVSQNPIVLGIQSGNLPQFYFAPNGTLGVQSSGIVATANFRNVGAVNKNASAWGGVTVSACLNGGAVAGGGFAGFSGLDFYIDSMSPTQVMDGCFRNLKFYNQRLTDAELIAMTT